jgi:SPP1 family predicted phage head-tail adaptor
MAINIKTADLRHKVILKKPGTKTKNNEGGLQYGPYTEVMVTFAAIKEISQSRVNEANATALLNSKDFFIRWSTPWEEIDKDWIISYKGEDYIIHEVENMEEKNLFFRITAKVKTDG